MAANGIRRWTPTADPGVLLTLVTALYEQAHRAVPPPIYIYIYFFPYICFRFRLNESNNRENDRVLPTVEEHVEDRVRDCVSFSRFKWDGAKQDIEIRNWKKKLFQVERFVRCEIDENISRAGNWSYEIKFVYRNCKQDIIILLRWNIEHKIMIIILNIVSRYSYWNTLDHSDSFLRSNDFFINLKVTVASSYPNISVIIW